MSMIIKSLHVAHAKLGKDIAKHDRIIAASETKLADAQSVYQQKLALAEDEYQKSLALAAETRRLTLADAAKSLATVERSTDAAFNKSFHTRRTLATLHKRLGAALGDYDNRGEALKG